MHDKIVLWVSDPNLTSDTKGGGGAHLRSTIAGLQAQNIEVYEVNKLHGVKNVNPVSSRYRKTGPASKSPILKDLKWIVKVFLNNLRLLRKALSQEDTFIGLYSRVVVLDIFGPFFWRWCVNGPILIEFDGCVLELWKNSVGLKFENIARIILQRTLLSSDFVVCYNEANKKDIAERWKVPLEKIIIKSQGIQAFHPRTFSSPNSRDLVKFVYIGGGLPYHRIDWLVRSFHGTQLKFQLDIYGGGPCFLDVEKELLLMDSPLVRYHGAVSHSEVGALYEASDVVIIPGADEYVHPLRLLEALSYGKRVLAPRTKGIESLRLQGVELFDKESPKDMLKKMNKLKPLSASMSKSVVQSVQSRFSHETVVETVATIFNTAKNQS